ncbi:unnamed protein product [Chironomus riparius]|uniref:Uncharacterized protein n=1 Tax=Chironomus riparius TaxID=315576 RepID=A0A9P0JAB7_9DIPT|nr:unnamed protein product [Chironomus riparius]
MNQNMDNVIQDNEFDENSSVINAVSKQEAGKSVIMSSKIPVSIPYRRDPKKFLTPTKDNSTNLQKTPSNENCSNKKIQNSGDKFKHVSSKVCTHWSPEEKQRNGLKTFFQRKEKHQTYAVPLSPEIIRQVSRVKTNRRQSLPAQITLDPIGFAIESLKQNPMNSYSSCSSSSNSSFVSLPETSTDQ